MPFLARGVQSAGQCTQFMCYTQDGSILRDYTSCTSCSLLQCLPQSLGLSFPVCRSLGLGRVFFSPGELVSESSPNIQS